MAETKQSLRRMMMARLRALTPEQADALSAEVMSCLERQLTFQAAHTVLLYHSLPTEVCTHNFIERWSGAKLLLLPVVVGSELELRCYTGPGSMVAGRYGILEPVGPAFTDWASIDLVAVPGVAFDSHGGRLGRGKGYYDRLLPRLPRARKLGICFPFQLVESVPTDPHDVLMDAVITTT